MQGKGDQIPQPLLATKLYIPRSTRDVVARPRLFAHLSRGVNGRLTLISAPAGYGKTTLVTEWLRHPEQALPAAWVALDAGDNDPVRFWRYLITACRRFDAGIGQSALALLRAAQPPSWETILTLFINDLARLSRRGILVLEDYHLITLPRIHELVVFLLDHLPSTLHVIITARDDPPLPLPRLRTQSDFNELRAVDLRFSPPEIQAFFQQVIACPLDNRVVGRVEARTEGWVTGLRLLALMLQGRETPDVRTVEQLLGTFRGGHRHIFTYFITEVLDRQPAPLQDFLLRTSLLNRLTGSLCDAVTGREDGEIILEQLQQANLFLIPVDDTGQWYRYHALFAEAMRREARRRLGDRELRDLSRLATFWYEQHGFLTEAIEAALAARDFPRAADLIESAVAPEPVQNEYHTLRAWIGQMPEPVRHAHPTLCMIYAMAILFTSDRHAPTTMACLRRPLQIAERHWRDGGNHRKLGELLALRSLVHLWQGEQDRAFALAREAIALLPEDETAWRGIGLDVAGTERWVVGDLHAARRCAAASRALWKRTGNVYGMLAATLRLAEVAVQQGELEEATRLYRQVLAEVERAPMERKQALRRRGGAALGLAAVALERNELEAADTHATEAVAVGRQIGQPDLHVRGSLILARIEQARGRTEEARQRLHDLVTLVPERRWGFLLGEVRICQARLALASGEPDRAERFMAFIQQEDAGSRLQAEQEALLVAHLRLARGEPEAALCIVGDWRAEAHARGRVRSELELMLLQGLAQFAQRALPAARETLHAVLTRAQGHGYRRLFVDHGEPVAALLRLLWPDLEEPLASYVRTLLLILAQEQPDPAMLPDATGEAPSAPEPACPIRPLSPQERRVLGLLATGLSNTEIAAELVVSINTIKSQIRSIYRKLNVNSRQEARDAARHLNLA